MSAPPAGNRWAQRTVGAPVGTCQPLPQLLPQLPANLCEAELPSEPSLPLQAPLLRASPWGCGGHGALLSRPAGFAHVSPGTAEPAAGRSRVAWYPPGQLRLRPPGVRLPSARPRVRGRRAAGAAAASAWTGPSACSLLPLRMSERASPRTKPSHCFHSL
uniref:Uncharacterized protein n=1 Tax=Molossus molossus TaxID=27622 RepID=A0A7J8HZP3_MOLMO|nr:hypothetical protein HJG59_010746 [Molossus molossus]